MTGRRGRLVEIRGAMRAATLEDEAAAVRARIADADLSAEDRQGISARAEGLVRAVRSRAGTSIMEEFLAEYGLSTREGIALMCLAEALLRVPDTETMDALIEDKIGASDWASHLGHASSPLVNASTWALLMTGKVLGDAEAGLAGVLRDMIRRLGEPVIRAASARAMRELGEHFVLGRNIEEAIARAAVTEATGCTYSYDMLGEAARTETDARRYHVAYSASIAALADIGRDSGIRGRPGVSVKLSALHPRFEYAQRERVATELSARLLSLALLAKSAGIGLNVDAEEAERLDLSLDVVEAVLSDPGLAGWDGFGVVVQAYGKRAPHVIDWLCELSGILSRRIMVRLVKGAYWDTEIKRAQVLGLDGFPVFTRKANTDVSFLACARKLLGMADRIYPQFATHNAHTMAAVQAMAGGDCAGFEFQRLHGMGGALHEAVRAESGVRCRIYAPVGSHRDLLAYLVRRLLENGANSSFVNQIVDASVSPAEIARDPVSAAAAAGGAAANPRIAPPPDLFMPERRNAKGWDLSDPATVAALAAEREIFAGSAWAASPIVAGSQAGGPEREIGNPARPGEVVGLSADATPADVDAALDAAPAGAFRWASLEIGERAARLRRVADLFEENAPEIFALLAREAGKTWPDCVGEVREACDFARYYAHEAVRANAGAANPPGGVVACISPWNFPLAIFSGQVLGALAAGNAVVAKPAEQTPLVAARAVRLMHEAGIPPEALQMLPGGGDVGAALAAAPAVTGVCFTGSTGTARLVNRSMAVHLAPGAPLIAETGGLNAMAVDSTALPEQAVRDIVISAFQSAGQRCSALRMLYVQRDAMDRIEEMLFGAIDALSVGDPWELATDVGPIIDAEARDRITAYLDRKEGEGRIMKRPECPGAGHFVPPTVLRVNGIEDLREEIFGPVLHVAAFDSDRIDAVVDAVNAARYGLTFGLHTRIDDRVQKVLDRVRVGNIYVNRNQIGAVVGSQPFGGEAESGTGPKAGGPHYVRRLAAAGASGDGIPAGRRVAAQEIEAAVSKAGQGFESMPHRRSRIAAAGAGDTLPASCMPRDLPGPTGESNRLYVAPRGVVLCLGPGADAAARQLAFARRAGNAVVVIADGAEAALEPLASDRRVEVLDGQVAAGDLTGIEGIAAVACDAERGFLKRLRIALAKRPGPILPLIAGAGDLAPFLVERHLCVDTTAAGGNATLLVAAGT